MKLCPDCYETRKTQPDFIDDKRWSSAAGRVTLKHKTCLWCGGPIAAVTEAGRKQREGKQFCCNSHQKRWRRATGEERTERAARLARVAGD